MHSVASLSGIQTAACSVIGCFPAKKPPTNKSLNYCHTFNKKTSAKKHLYTFRQEIIDALINVGHPFGFLSGRRSIHGK